MSNTLNGTVIRSTGSWNTVLFEDDSVAECKLRGQFRMQGIRATNPITVGDKVKVAMDPSTGQGVINEIEDRRNYVIRKSVNLSKEVHVIASNLDQAAIIITIEQPRTSYGFIDRFLSTTEAYGIPAAIVINKVDLYTEPKSLKLLTEYAKTYESIGYLVFVVSSTNMTGLEEVERWMTYRTTLVSGHSGVGKSTFINALHPELDLRTGDISEAHSKGKHTTTFAEMFRLPKGGFIIDTPGIKEFGMIDMSVNEVGSYFPEIFKASDACKYHNCTHQNEPDCRVKTLVENGQIPESRYNSYLNILESLK